MKDDLKASRTLVSIGILINNIPATFKFEKLSELIANDYRFGTGRRSVVLKWRK